MLLIEGLRSLQRPTYLQTPIGGHHHQLRSLDLVGQLTNILLTIPIPSFFPNSTLFTFWEDLKALTPIPCQIYLHSAFTTSFKSQKRGELYL